MISGLVRELRAVKDVVFHSGVETPLLTRFEAESGLVLPLEHKELLLSSNGAEAYAGYIRLFGLYNRESTDLVCWNQHDFWKFAWGDRCSEYWCFGETAWGDQYAYQVDSLKAGADGPVFFMDALSMTAEVIAPTFAEFLLAEFVPSATGPYDEMIKQARTKFGPLEVSNHLVYVPSILLGGVEEIGNVRKMNARSAMIGNGDIATQLDIGPAHGTVEAVKPYEDERHRMRLRLVWR
jgi:hypothetical protein